MRVTEVFKAQSVDERRKAVTELLIKLENKKYNEEKADKQPKAG